MFFENYKQNFCYKKSNSTTRVYRVQTIPKMRKPPKISNFSPNKHFSHNERTFVALTKCAYYEWAQYIIKDLFNFLRCLCENMNVSQWKKVYFLIFQSHWELLRKKKFSFAFGSRNGALDEGPLALINTHQKYFYEKSTSRGLDLKQRF